jgi:hypothetical protein
MYIRAATQQHGLALLNLMMRPRKYDGLNRGHGPLKIEFSSISFWQQNSLIIQRNKKEQMLPKFSYLAVESDTFIHVITNQGDENRLRSSFFLKQILHPINRWGFCIIRPRLRARDGFISVLCNHVGVQQHAFSIVHALHTMKAFGRFCVEHVGTFGVKYHRAAPYMILFIILLLLYFICAVGTWRTVPTGRDHPGCVRRTE